MLKSALMISWPGTLEASLHYGRPYMNTAGALNIMPGTQGLLDILKPLGTEVDRWASWFAGHRAEKLLAEKRENNLTADEIITLKTLNGNVAEDDVWRGEGTRAETYQRVAEAFNEFKKAFLDIGEKAGTIEPTHYQVVEAQGEILGDFQTLEEAQAFAAENPRGQLFEGEESEAQIVTRGRAMWEDFWYIPFYRARKAVPDRRMRMSVAWETTRCPFLVQTQWQASKVYWQGYAMSNHI